MNGGKRPLGYTIIEVLIVLAVSGVMFGIAAQFINGKHEKTSFEAGVNEMVSRLQDTIEQVSNGQFSDVPVNCKFSGGTTTTFPGGAPNQQGTNAQCVFLGKILHFAEQKNSTWPNAERFRHYEIFLIAGGRLTANVTPATLPQVLDAEVIPNVIKQQLTPQSLDVKTVTVTDTAGGTHATFGFGFLQGQGGLDATGNTQNGSAPVRMYYVDTINNNSNSPSAQAATKGSNLKEAATVDMCLTDDTQSANIRLGFGNSSKLSVNVKRNGTATPLCP